MSTKLLISCWILTASAAGSWFLPSALPRPVLIPQTSIAQPRTQLQAKLENNDGKLRLNLTNNAAQEFRGVVRISLGSDTEQREIGELALQLAPQDITLLTLANASPSGQQYTLTIYDQKGALVIYKVSTMQRVSDTTPSRTVQLIPSKTLRPARANTANTALGTSNRNPVETPTEVSVTDEAARLASSVQVQAHLLAGTETPESFAVAFELSSQRPFYNATLAISVGKHKDSKPTSVNRTTHVEFKLPGHLETDRIAYVLNQKDGRILAKGEIQISQLMAEDTITVADIRTDRASYELGQLARVTVVLDGKSRNGYRLEVQAKDGQGLSFFSDQRQVSAEDTTKVHEFTITLATNASTPLTFEFRIFDLATGLLFDSGERTIPLTEK